MHESLLARAALPNPAVVLGLLLKPYSLGHDLRLIRINNPLHNSNEASPRELAEAVLICHQGWEETNRMPHDPLLRFKFWIWRRRARKLNFKTELLKFIAYRNDANVQFPPSEIQDIDAPKSTPRILGCPPLLRLHQFLMVQLRMTEAQAWDYPVGLAVLRFQAMDEAEGGSRIYNYLEAQHDAAVEKARREGEELLKKEGVK